MKRFFWSAVVLITAMLLMSCSYNSSAYIAVARLPTYSGMTVCVNEKPYSFIGAEYVGTDAAILILPHEAKHREQIQRFPSCKAYVEYYNTRVGHAEIESEAQAAGYCAAVKKGFSREQVFQSELGRLLSMQNVKDSVFVKHEFTRFIEECDKTI